MTPSKPIIRQFSFDALRNCAQCSQQFVLGLDGVIIKGLYLCDKCAGVARTIPGGYVVLINDKPAVEVD